MIAFKALRVFSVLVVAVCLATSVASAQQSKKEYALRGKVEALDEIGNRLTVNHEKIEGFMDAMTMSYKVDNPDVFKKVKPGDQIEATLSASDLTLHNIRVISAGTSAPKKK